MFSAGDNEVATFSGRKMDQNPAPRTAQTAQIFSL
jgi:hypothetical protein